MSIKVRDFNSAGRLPDALKTVAARDSSEAAQLSFRRTLTELSKQEHEAHLTALAADIEEQGKRLSKHAVFEELERYRALIRSFLNDVVSNGYEFSRESASGGRGRGRFFVIVKTVDEKLTELARAVLDSQESELDILARVGELQGLIVDLIV
ncbi:MAG: YaaR family protein [Oscillospiraceae bacterium]|nr:YaaR family protein [Oscillospiraceae bacterium]